MIDRNTYFNTAHVALPTQGVSDVLSYWHKLQICSGPDDPALKNLVVHGGQLFNNDIPSLRETYASLSEIIGVDPGSLAFQPTFGDALRLALHLAQKRLGRPPHILLSDRDHYTVHIVVRSYAETSGSKVSVERYDSDEVYFSNHAHNVSISDADVVVVTDIDNETGVSIYNEDMKNVLSERITIVDVAQSLGRVSLKRWNLLNDVIFVGCGHKWLGGIRSLGVVASGISDLSTEGVENFLYRNIDSSFYNYNQLNVSALEDFGSVIETPLLALGVSLKERDHTLLDEPCDPREFSDQLSRWGLAAVIPSPNHTGSIWLIRARDFSSDADLARAVLTLRKEYGICVSYIDNIRRNNHGIRICFVAPPEPRIRDYLFDSIAKTIGAYSGVSRAG